MSDEEEVKFRRGSLITWPVIKVFLIFFPLIIAVGIAMFFYAQWQQTQEQFQQVVREKEIEDVKEEEIKQAVKALEKNVLLPMGETPTLSTITNKEELVENQDFFDDAENGDQVLVYHEAKKAFLYRPSTGKLINLAPINITGGDGGSSGGQLNNKNNEEIDTSPGLDRPVTIELRNGTEVVGATYKIESKLEEVLEGREFEVLGKENASRLNFEKTVVVVGNLVQKSVAQQVANGLDLPVVNLPEGEKKTDADFLVVVGKDIVE